MDAWWCLIGTVVGAGPQESVGCTYRELRLVRMLVEANLVCRM